MITFIYTFFSDCKEVLTLHNKFKELLDTKQLDINVKSFIETRLTLMAFIYVRIVSEESASKLSLVHWTECLKMTK